MIAFIPRLLEGSHVGKTIVQSRTLPPIFRILPTVNDYIIHPRIKHGIDGITPRCFDHQRFLLRKYSSLVKNEEIVRCFFKCLHSFFFFFFLTSGNRASKEKEEINTFNNASCKESNSVRGRIAAR